MERRNRMDSRPSRRRNRMVGGILCLTLSFLVPVGSAQAILQEKEDDKVKIEDPNVGVDAMKYLCYFEGTVIEAGTGNPIKGASVTFRKTDGSHTRSTLSRDSGYFRIEVRGGTYRYSATHPDHIMYSNDPSSVSVRAPYIETYRGHGGVEIEVLITSESHRDIDIELDRRPEQVLLVTTSLLDGSAALDDAIDRYIEVMDRKEGMEATHVVLDSAACRSEFGVRLDDPGDWEETREVLGEIVEETGPAYIILLGGPAVVARPSNLLDPVFIGHVKSDAWYLDFDRDNVMDPGFAIGRFPDVSGDSGGVVAALETAIDLHEAWGYRLDREAQFCTICWYPPPLGVGDTCSESDDECGTCYRFPPYGTCSDCTREDDFFSVISWANYLKFCGHGNAFRFSTEDRDPYFSTDDIASVDLQTRHPVVSAFTPCDAGELRRDDPTLATEFLRAGAGAYVAKTTSDGIASHFGANFEPYIMGTSDRPSYRIGDALYELMRETILREGATDEILNITVPINLYGDPTLDKTVRWFTYAVQPRFTDF